MSVGDGERKRLAEWCRAEVEQLGKASFGFGVESTTAINLRAIAAALDQQDEPDDARRQCDACGDRYVGGANGDDCGRPGCPGKLCPIPGAAALTPPQVPSEPSEAAIQAAARCAYDAARRHWDDRDARSWDTEHDSMRDGWRSEARRELRAAYAVDGALDAQKESK